MKQVLHEVERGVCNWTFCPIDPNSKTVKEHGVLQCNACGALVLAQYLSSSECPVCNGKHFRPVIVKHRWLLDLRDRVPECPLNSSISNRTGSPIGFNKNSIYFQSDRQTCSIRNNSKEQVLIQLEHIPSWMHSNITWSDAPIKLNPEEEFCLEFTRDFYAPEAQGHEIIIWAYPTNFRSELVGSDQQGKGKQHNLRVYSNEKLGASWICLVISIGASLGSLYSLSNLLKSESIFEYLSGFAFYLSAVLFIAWSIQPGCVRNWLETLFGTSSNLENRELLKNASKIYVHLVDRPYSLLLRIVFFPAIYLSCVILMGFATLILDVTKLRSIPLVRLILCAFFVLALAYFHRRAYPEVIAHIIKQFFERAKKSNQVTPSDEKPEPQN